jgi:pyridoxamine 5'-phosphate oxidase
MDLSGLREEYGRGGLDLPDLAADPIEMFERWLRQVVEAGVHEPNAMVLSTATPEGGPSSRMVLLKGVGPDGFVFYTNHASRKGAELAADPRCALLFPWHPLERQVRVEGVASVIPEDEVEAYFRSRPRGAQLGAWA